MTKPDGHDCPECGKVCGNAGALASHRRARHPELRWADVSVVEAVASVVEDAARRPDLKRMALQLATAMDNSTSARDLPSLSKELRAVLDDLLDADATEDEPSAFDELAERRRERGAAS